MIIAKPQLIDVTIKEVEDFHSVPIAGGADRVSICEAGSICPAAGYSKRMARNHAAGRLTGDVR
jgi:hypothetical protein